MFGVPKKRRRTYKLWAEKKSPSFVIEVTSESTCDEDVDKMRKYARLGVAEYFLFDPLDEYLVPRFQGFRLAGDRYEPIQPEADGGLTSRTTGLRLRVEDERLRLVDAATGEPLLRMQEVEEAETRRGMPPKRGRPKPRPKPLKRPPPAAPPRRKPSKRPPRLGQQRPKKRSPGSAALWKGASDAALCASPSRAGIDQPRRFSGSVRARTVAAARCPLARPAGSASRSSSMRA